jgi:hypothetical protein
VDATVEIYYSQVAKKLDTEERSGDAFRQVCGFLLVSREYFL